LSEFLELGMDRSETLMLLDYFYNSFDLVNGEVLSMEKFIGGLQLQPCESDLIEKFVFNSSRGPLRKCEVTLREFVVHLWSFLTLQGQELAHFAFLMYTYSSGEVSPDSQGSCQSELRMEEVQMLMVDAAAAASASTGGKKTTATGLRTKTMRIGSLQKTMLGLHGVANLDVIEQGVGRLLEEEMRVSSFGSVTCSEWALYARRVPELLAPLRTLQGVLRQHVCGARFWEGMLVRAAAARTARRHLPVWERMHSLRLARMDTERRGMGGADGAPTQAPSLSQLLDTNSRQSLTQSAFQKALGVWAMDPESIAVGNCDSHSENTDQVPSLPIRSVSQPKQGSSLTPQLLAIRRELEREARSASSSSSSSGRSRANSFPSGAIRQRGQSTDGNSIHEAETSCAEPSFSVSCSRTAATGTYRSDRDKFEASATSTYSGYSFGGASDDSSLWKYRVKPLAASPVNSRAVVVPATTPGHQ
jgi:hypothetical protein